MSTFRDPSIVGGLRIRQDPPSSPPTLFDPSPTDPGVKIRHDAPDTARAAARSHLPRSGTARARVLLALADAPLTDDELQATLRMGPNTQRPRRVECVDAGWVRDSGRRRTTDTGHDAIVWETTDTGQAAARTIRTGQ